MVAGAERRAERLDELFAEEARGAVAVWLVVDPEGAARAESLERGLNLDRIVSEVVVDVDAPRGADPLESAAHPRERSHGMGGVREGNAGARGRGDREERVLHGENSREGHAH